VTGGGAVRFVEPAGDGVAGEADHAAALAGDGRGERDIDRIDLLSEGLDAGAAPQYVGKRLGQRREAGDVGEQRSAAGAVGERHPAGEGPGTILW
jgi:hypothetical protein